MNAWEIEKAKERFWSKIQKSDGCWVSTKPNNRNRRGGSYGYFDWEKKRYGAHRFSWMIHNGAIPDGLYVCHECDNPPCVRPEHLFLGTSRDNALDMVRKKRNVDLSEGKSPMAKFGVDTAVEMILLAAKGEMGQDLAKRFNVAEASISRVLSGFRWKSAWSRIENPSEVLNRIQKHRSDAHRGERNSTSKLKWETVRAIRNDYKQGILYIQLQQKYGISLGCVGNIITGKSWKE